MPNKYYNGDRAFEFLCGCARRGERCPMNDVIPGGAPIFGVLAKLGRIRVEVYVKNFRRVTILKGPDAGKTTADPPKDHAGRLPLPYLTNGPEGLFRNGKAVERGAAARRREGLGPSAPRMIQIGKVKFP